jgi:hypothetical protein
MEYLINPSPKTNNEKIMCTIHVSLNFFFPTYDEDGLKK